MFASLSHTHYWYEVGMLKVLVQRSNPREFLFIRVSKGVLSSEFKEKSERI